MCCKPTQSFSTLFAALLALTAVLVTPAHAQIFFETVSSGPFIPSTFDDELTYAADVSSSDLLHGIQGTGGSWNGGGSSPDGLNDGLAGGDFDFDGNPIALQGKAWAAAGDATSFREFELGGGVNGLGFNLIDIQSIASWQGAGFANQKYEIRVRTLGEADFPVAPLATVDYQPFPTTANAGGSSKVNVKETTGILASNVVAIRFDMLDIEALTTDNTVMAEIDVFGSDSTGPYLQVNQQSGEIKLINSSDSSLNFVFRDYAITSAAGALDPGNRTTIAGTYDSAGNSLIDGDSTWIVQDDTESSFSEAASGGDGQGSLAIGVEASLGIGAWLQNPTKDLVVSYTDGGGSSQSLPVVYIGDDIPLGDLNYDGVVNAADWPLFRANNQADTTGLSPAEAYQLGDFNLDGRNSVSDFLLFRQAYIEANPAPGAFEALVGGPVPEPGSLVLLGIFAAGFGLKRFFHNQTAKR